MVEEPLLLVIMYMLYCISWGRGGGGVGVCRAVSKTMLLFLGNGQELRLQCSDTTLGQQMPMLTHSFTIFPFTPDATGYGSVINGMYAISTTWSYTLPGAW